MKKTIYVLSIITVIGFTGCSKADIEKKPVSITEETNLEDKIAETLVNNDLNEEGAEEEEKGIKGETEGEIKKDEVSEPIIIEIEGMEETINGVWHTGEGYKIAYDVDRFQYSNKDDADTFIAENPDPAIYPYVYLSVKHLGEKSVSDYTKELSDQLSKDDFQVELTTESSIGKYEGTILTARAGSEWNSIIRKYYIIEDGTSLYTLEAQYFLEASEGYGARIHAMLDTFKMK